MIILRFQNIQDIKIFSKFVNSLDTLVYSPYARQEILSEIQRASFGPLKFRRAHFDIQSSYNSLSPEQRKFACKCFGLDLTQNFLCERTPPKNATLLDYSFDLDGSVSIAWKYKNQMVTVDCMPSARAFTIREQFDKEWTYSPSARSYEVEVDIVNLYEMLVGKSYTYSIEDIIEFLYNLGIDRIVFDSEFRDHLAEILL